MDDEGNLLQRAQKQDPAALTEIYDRYAARIYGYVCTCIDDRAAAEDIAAEVFLHMLEAIGKSRFAHTSLGAWLYRIARNLVIDYYRQHRTPPVPLEHQKRALEVGAEIAENQALQDQVRQALRHLTPEQQQVIVLRFGQRMKASEIARALDRSEEAVRGLQRRALASLRKVLEEER